MKRTPWMKAVSVKMPTHLIGLLPNLVDQSGHKTLGSLVRKLLQDELARLAIRTQKRTTKRARPSTKRKATKAAA